MALNPQARDLVWKPYRDEGCTLCPLYRDARTVCLMGDGPVPAKIMLVGEAPGYREDEVSRPFSGAAGQLLDRTLERVGLRREDVFITNACRCHPDANRTPTRSEIKACGVHMSNELKAVEPQFVVVMGNSALQALLNTSGVMKKRGTSVQKDGRTYFVTVHPAAVLRNPGLEQDFINDFMALSRLVKGEDSKPVTKSYLITGEKSLQKVFKLMESVTTPIAFDVETRHPDRDQGALEPWAPGGLIDTLALCWEPGVAYVIALDHPDAGWKIPVPRIYQAIGVALEGKKLVGHNIKFDIQWLRAKGLTSVRAHFDTLLAAHLLDENRSNRLKSLARTFLGADMYEAGISFSSEAADLKRLAIYNGKDADYTLRLYHLFRKQLLEQPKIVRIFKLLTMPACNALIDIELRGFPVDYERLKTRNRQLIDDIASTENEIIDRWVPDHLKGARPNFRSPLFLSAWLFGEKSLRLPIIEVSPRSNRPSTREGVLLQLRDKHPAVDKLMELRKLYKYENTYTRNWMERVAITSKPRLYPSYNIAGTVTGRLSSNMQQVPRDTYIRSIIGTRAGWKLIEADFSQVELRIAAMLSHDPELVRAFNEDKDVHALTAWESDHNATISAAELPRMWLGVSADGAGSKVLSELLSIKERIDQAATVEVYLRSSSSFWKDKESGGWKWRSSMGGEQPILEGRSLATPIPETQKEILRAMQEYSLSTSSSQRPQPLQQRRFEFRDALQVVSSVAPHELPQIFGSEWKEHRKKAKAIGFGFLYGMGWRKFKIYAKEKYDVAVSDDQAKEYREAFFRKYAGLPRWHARQRRLVNERGWVGSPIGRIRHLPTINSADDGMVAEAERQAINSPVQGLASDFTVLSMVLLHKKLDRTRIKVLGNLHDALMFEVKDEYAEEASKIIRETMENLPLKSYFGFRPTVPIKVDVTVRTHWGE